MAGSSFTKDPQAVLDYAWDWSAWLDDGETISSHAVTVPTGITMNSSILASGVVTVWLSGGTIDVRYPVVCHITTSAGRQDERTILVTVRER